VTPGVVFFHAHPDDEALLTGGTMAKSAAAGHRVVLVVATDGRAGLSSDAEGESLAQQRVEELQASARELGCAEVILLGYADSGLQGEHADGFAHQHPVEAAERLASIIEQCGASTLVSYDSNGGYGHPDHRQVHVVGRLAAALQPGVRLLEATVNRDLLVNVLRPLHLLRAVPPEFRPAALAHAFSAPSEITHKLDVRAFADHKRRAMQAHRSQLSGGDGERTLAYCLRLRPFLFRRAFGTEWFTQVKPGTGPDSTADVFGAR